MYQPCLMRREIRTSNAGLSSNLPVGPPAQPPTRPPSHPPGNPATQQTSKPANQLLASRQARPSGDAGGLGPPARAGGRREKLREQRGAPGVDGLAKQKHTRARKPQTIQQTVKQQKASTGWSSGYAKFLGGCCRNNDGYPHREDGDFRRAGQQRTNGVNTNGVAAKVFF